MCVLIVAGLPEYVAPNRSVCANFKVKANKHNFNIHLNQNYPKEKTFLNTTRQKSNFKRNDIVMAELSKANIDSSVPKKKTQNVKKTSPTKTMSKVGEKSTTTFQKMTSTVGNVVTSDRKPEKSLKSAKAAAAANPKNTIKRKFVSKLLVSKSPNNAAAVVPKKIVPKEMAVSDAKKLVRPKKRVSISTTNKVAISFPKQNKPQQHGDEPKPGNSG